MLGRWSRAGLGLDDGSWGDRSSMVGAWASCPGGAAQEALPRGQFPRPGSYRDRWSLGSAQLESPISTPARLHQSDLPVRAPSQTSQQFH
ncbi:MAG: hypothetical protein HC824_02055 [Synechococcales cyanobacterium RM1_1_8]|nr:hypothetical protein [Synechococcales cyanobacterium RM1_1_8]